MSADVSLTEGQTEGNEPLGWGDRRRREEVWTWELMAALTEAGAVKRLVEGHAGGGMYDTVAADLDGRAPGAVVHVACNRPGRVHVIVAETDDYPVRDLLGDIDQGRDPMDAAVWVVEVADARPGSPGSALAVSVAMMAAAVAAGIGAGGEWHWRQGDMDPGWLGWRLFDAIPAARRAFADDPGSDETGGAGRFWFLLSGYRAVLAVDTITATLHSGEDSVPLESPASAATWRAAMDAAGATSPFPPVGMAKPAARKAFARAARCLAGQFVDNPQEFERGHMSGRVAWFVDPADETLVAVIAPCEDLKVADEVFAYALAWRRDRDLLIVAPPTHLAATAARAAWIDTTVRLYRYGPELLCRAVLVPARAEVTATAQSKERPLHGGGVYKIGEPAATWIAPLVEWATNQPDLAVSHRASGLSWQCQGHQVLRIARAGAGGATVWAGTNAKAAPACPVPVDGPLVEVALAGVQAKVSQAITAVTAPDNDSYVEHRFQAALARGVLRDHLGLVDHQREYPAWRADGGSGSIDFLGVDSSGKIHVVETKVGASDPGVVLQVLDYAVWVSAHADEIRVQQHWIPGPCEVVIDLILAPKGAEAAVGRYLVGQLEALSRDLEWRVSVAADPLAEKLVLSGPGHHRIPAPLTTAVQESRWPRVVGPPADGTQLGPPRMFRNAAPGVLPPAVWAYDGLKTANLLHRYFRSARSSQAFALNVFGPLQPAGVVQVFGMLGHHVVEVDAVEFEFTDPHDYLNEGSRRTQVDVVLRGLALDGTRRVALIEVKLTESNFGGCSAYEDTNHDSRLVCHQAGLFGGDPCACPQLTGHVHGPRYYDRYLDPPASNIVGRSGAGGCAVRLGANQAMRNLALGGALVHHGHADQVTFAVCAPAAHPTIWRRLQEASEVLGPIAALRAEQVVSAHPDAGAAFEHRYPELHT